MALSAGDFNLSWTPDLIEYMLGEIMVSRAIGDGG